MQLSALLGLVGPKVLTVVALLVLVQDTELSLHFATMTAVEAGGRLSLVLEDCNVIQ